MKGDDPLVSIVCITYQHAKYIRKALDGFLLQRINFPIEIIVHDDASTDGTAEIVREYATAHPGLFVTLLQTENQYSKEKGRINKIAFSAARGKYIALCEGDDHWIDPDKLQRQIQALESDLNAIGCFTDAYNERNGNCEPFMGPYASTPKGCTIDQLDWIKGQGIPTCTFLFRHVDLKHFHEIRKLAPVGDVILYTFLLNFGYFLYQPERTGVRVIHEGGIHSLRKELHKLRVHLELLPLMDHLSNYQYSDLLTLRRRKALEKAWSEAITTNNRELAKYVWPKIAKERGLYDWNLTTTIRNFFKAYWPLPDKLYGRLTGK